MKKIAFAIMILMSASAHAQNGMPQANAPVTLSAEVYNAVQRYLRVTPGGNPIDLMQAMYAEQKRSEDQAVKDKKPDEPK